MKGPLFFPMMENQLEKKEMKWRLGLCSGLIGSK